jgi:hypothetical protein
MSKSSIALANQTDVDKLSKNIDELEEKVGDGNSGATIAFSNCAAGHNGIYRGKDLTNVYSISEICDMVSKGTFDDLYIGDFITKTITTSYGGSEEVDILFADFNTFLHKGDTELTQNHITCVPKDCFKTTASMNATAVTTNGYSGSVMHSTTLPVYATALNNALDSHIITHRSLLSSAVSTSGNSMAGAGLTGYASNWAWADTKLSLMSEIQLYGSNICSSSFYDTGERNTQFALFRLAPELMVAGLGKGGSRQYYWLSAVAGSTHFASCTNSGDSTGYLASNARGVRPYFLIG